MQRMIYRTVIYLKPGTPKTRPEIFVMGCRNPFRFSVDARRKLVHWGDVGPDTGKDSIGRSQGL